MINMDKILDREKILNEIEKLDESCVSELVFFDETSSTNDDAKKLANKGAKDCTLIIARRQNGGRGRMGRSFLSEEGGIYLSYIIRPKSTLYSALKITAGAAVAVMRAIKSYCGDVLIKWVNDVYIGNKKACGILCESAISDGGKSADFIVVGIGINVFGKSESFGGELKDIVTTIEENTDIDININKLAAEVVSNLYKVYKSLDNFDDIISAYRENSLVLGQNVYLFEAGKKALVNVLDIDDEGALIVKDEFSNIRKIGSGEVSLRFKE